MDTIQIHETWDAMMKSIIDVQQRQNKQIEELGIMINGIRETMVTNLRFELTDAMMDAIVRGYTTKEEYTRISEKMYNYVNHLNGNHGLTEIYEEKYKKLNIQ